MSSNKQPGLPTEVSYNEAVEASKKYFDGDDLAATVWVSKYALKDSYGHIYEKTPRDMHERIAAEIERIKTDLEELGQVEQMPKMEGRQMVMILAPTRKK